MRHQALISGLLALFSFSMCVSAQVIENQPGHYTVRTGNCEVTALVDGIYHAPAYALLKDGDSLTIAGALKRSFLTDTVETSINCFLIKSGDRLILVDAGAGTLLGASAGLLLKNIRAAGYTAAEVTDVLITHIHIDHASGVSDGKNMLFPNARVHVNKKDLAFWKQHEQGAANEAAGITLNRPAYLMLKSYINSGKVVTFGDGDEIVPGIRAMEYAGHTSGHTVFLLESGGEKLAFWGDLIHIPAVQFEHPDMGMEFDFDKAAGKIQREKAYDDASSKGYLVAAAHISFPGIGHVRKEHHSYRWYPVNYSLTGNNK